MSRLDEIKSELRTFGATPEDMEWLIARVERLEEVAGRVREYLTWCHAGNDPSRALSWLEGPINLLGADFVPQARHAPSAGGAWADLQTDTEAIDGDQVL